MNKSKIFMIVSICVLCVAVIGSTLAYYITTLFNDLTVDTITHGLDYYIEYTGGQDITSATLEPSTDYTEGQSTKVELWKIDNTYEIYGHIYIDVNEIGDVLSSSSALKYTVVNNGNILSQGTLKGTSNGESVLTAVNIPLETSAQYYDVYIWLDENEEPSSDINSENLSLTVRCEATMKTIIG